MGINEVVPKRAACHSRGDKRRVSQLVAVLCPIPPSDSLAGLDWGPQTCWCETKVICVQVLITCLDTLPPSYRRFSLRCPAHALCLTVHAVTLGSSPAQRWQRLAVLKGSPEEERTCCVQGRELRRMEGRGDSVALTDGSATF